MGKKLKARDLKRGTESTPEKDEEELPGSYILFSNFNHNHAIKDSLKNTE